MQTSYPTAEELTATQRDSVTSDTRSFLRGQAGTGKSTALLHRLGRLLEERNVTELATSQSTSVTERETALVLGAGVTFEIGRIRMRTYFQSIDRAESDLNSLGAAAEFRF